MCKKSQVSVFIIVGIMLLVLASFAFMLNLSVSKPNTSYQPTMLQGHVETCINSIVSSSMHGGFLSLESAIEGEISQCVEGYDYQGTLHTGIPYADIAQTPDYLDIILTMNINIEQDKAETTEDMYQARYSLINTRPIEYNANRVSKEIIIASTDGRARLIIPAGTIISGNPQEVSLRIIDLTQSAYFNSVDKVAYQVLPKGITFNSPVKLEIEYDPFSAASQTTVKQDSLGRYTIYGRPTRDNLSIIQLVQPAPLGTPVPGFTVLATEKGVASQTDRNKITGTITAAGAYAIAPGQSHVYYKPVSFYTTSTPEKLQLQGKGITQFENIAYLPEAGDRQLHLFRSDLLESNLYTTDPDEVELLKLNRHLQYKGAVAGLYSEQQENTAGLYRLQGMDGSIIYTTSSGLVNSARSFRQSLENLYGQATDETNKQELREKVQELTTGELLGIDYQPYILDSFLGYAYTEDTAATRPFIQATYAKPIYHLYRNNTFYLIFEPDSTSSHALITGMYTQGEFGFDLAGVALSAAITGGVPVTSLATLGYNCFAAAVGLPTTHDLLAPVTNPIKDMIGGWFSGIGDALGFGDDDPAAEAMAQTQADRAADVMGKMDTSPPSAEDFSDVPGYDASWGGPDRDPLGAVSDAMDAAEAESDEGDEGDGNGPEEEGEDSDSDSDSEGSNDGDGVD